MQTESDAYRKIISHSLFTLKVGQSAVFRPSNALSLNELFGCIQVVKRQFRGKGFRVGKLSQGFKVTRTR